MTDEASPQPKISPIRATDSEALKTVADLMGKVRIASLAFVDAKTGRPSLSRVAIMRSAAGDMVSMVSELSAHTRSLAANPAAALLLGEADGKGDPLNQARLTLHCDARFITRKTPDVFAALQAEYLAQIPKAKVYADFLDFRFVMFEAASASLNGGFGKAYELTKRELKAAL